MRSRYACLAAVLFSTWASAQIGTQFTYQGELADAGGLASGPHDFQFRLFSDEALTLQVGPTLCANDVPVESGRFTTSLDFGDVIADAPVFLQVSVRTDSGLDCANAAGMVNLAPAQELTAAPLAGLARNATLLEGQDGAFYRSAANLTGTLSDAHLSANVPRLNAGQTFSGQVTFSNASSSYAGNGAGLTGLNAANLASGSVPGARLSGAYGSLLTFSHPGNTFIGSGTGLTDLNANSITLGTLNDVRLSSNIPRLNGSNSFTGSVLSIGGRLVVGSGVPGATNSLDLNCSPTSPPRIRVPDVAGAALIFRNEAAAAGTKSWKLITGSTAFQVLPMADDDTLVAGNGLNLFRDGSLSIAGPVAAPSFAGNGASLSGLNATALTTGTVADARLSSNIALRNATNTFSGAVTVNGVLAANGGISVPVTSRTLQVLACEFQLTLGSINDAECKGTNIEGINTLSGDVYASAAIHLPEGATITAIALICVDNDPAQDIELNVYRYGAVTDTISSEIAGVNSGGSSTSIRTFTDSSVTSPVIDNDNLVYRADISFDYASGDRGLIEFRGVRISYNVTTPMP